MNPLKPILYILIASAMIVSLAITFWPESKMPPVESGPSSLPPEKWVEGLEYDSLYIRGRNIFFTHCVFCHSPQLEKDNTGPALYRLMDRVPSREWLYPYIQNSRRVIESGDPYAVALKAKWRSVMDPMPLSAPDIDCVIRFIEEYDPNRNTIHIVPGGLK